MSEIKDELLRTLDRIVDDYPLAYEPSSADIERNIASHRSSAHNATRESAVAQLRDEQRQDRWKAIADAGLTSVGGTGGDSDISFEDAAAIIRRAAYHSLDLPLGELIFARRIAARAGMMAPDAPFAMAPSKQPGAITLHQGSKDGLQVTGSTIHHGSPFPIVLVDCMTADGREHLAIVEPADSTVIVPDNRLNLADEPRRSTRLHEDPTAYRPQRLLALAETPNARNELIEDGALLRSIQMAGAMDRVLEHALTWVNDRVQFGKPIAKHQAVQHLMAQLAEEVAAASAAVDFAVEASAAKPDRFAVAVAKARAGEAAGKAANIAHAVFGAMGFTREHTLHHATRRLWAWRNEFGGETYWQGEIGRLIAAGGGASLWPTLTARG